MWIALAIACLAGTVLQGRSASIPFEVVRSEIGTDGARRVSLRLATGAGGFLQTLEVQGHFAEIQEVRQLAGGRLLVRASLARGGNVSFLYGGPGLVGTFKHYGDSLSPSGRFLLIRSWYPRMIDPVLRRSILLLFDLQQAILRPFELDMLAPGQEWPSALVDIPVMPVFPRENYEQRSFDPMLADPHLVLSPFLWSTDDSHLVFIAFDRGENVLITLSGFNGPDGLEVKRNQINVAELVPSQWDSPEVRERISRGYRFLVEGIEWSESGTIRVRPYPQYWLPETVEFGLR